MAQKLSVQIELAGAAEIARQLESLGETGKNAFEEMGAAAEKVGGFSQLDPTEVTQKLQDMGITGVDAINQIQDAVQQAGNLEGLVQGVSSLEKGFGALGRIIRPLGGEIRKIQAAFTAVHAAAGTLGVAGVAAFAAVSTAVTIATKVTIGFAESINKVNDEAIRLGSSVANLDRFRASLEQAGVSAESVGQILQSKIASEQGVKGLEAFISALEKMPDGLQRNKAATEAFGVAGAELIRILQAGGRLTGFGPPGGLIKEEDAQKATRLGQAINQLESAWNRFNSVQAAPALTAGINAATAAVQVLGQRLGTLPGTASVAAQGLFTPFQLGAQLVVGAIGQLITKSLETGSAVQQAGQQGSLVFTQWGTVAQQTVQQVEGAGPQITGMFSAWGTSLDAATTKTEALKASWASIAWDSIKSAGVAAWNAIVPAIEAAGTAVGDFVSKIASIAWDTISSAGVAAWKALTSAIQGAIDKLLKFIGLRPSGGAPSGEGAPGNARGGLLGGRGTGTSDSNLAWVSRGEHIMPARVVAQPGVLALLEALRRGGGIPGFAEGGFIRGVAISGSRLGEDISNWIVKIAEANNETRTALQRVVASIATLAEGLTSKLFDVVNDMTNKLNVLNAAGHARGGLLGGRGTGTSDSNLAWLSRGEYITPARAVAQPGVLAFLEALRRSGGDLRRVLAGMGQFALGGMVPRAIPAFAAGGLAGGGSNVTIQFPGLPAISGLRASADVVDQLHKAAALAQVRSGGRKPSRYS